MGKITIKLHRCPVPTDLSSYTKRDGWICDQCGDKKAIVEKRFLIFFKRKSLVSCPFQG